MKCLPSLANLVDIRVSFKGNAQALWLVLIKLQSQKPKQIYRPEVYLQHLIDAELVDRQLRSLRYKLKAASFLINHDLVEFYWR